MALSPAVRRALLRADADTGEVAASETVLRALSRLGLAVPHGRRGAHYLTERGRAARAGLTSGAAPPSTSPPTSPPAEVTAFVAATGHEPPAEIGAEETRRRRSEVSLAWHALGELRRLTAVGTRAEPAPWELTRPVQAIALALEAAGLPAAAIGARGRVVRSGYQVTAGDRAAARVEWRAVAGTAAPADLEQRLRECARFLHTAGWEALLYRGGRWHCYLDVTSPGPGPDAPSTPGSPG